MSLSKTRIAVFVSGGGTNLQALIDAAKRGEIPNGEIALVLASNDKAYALTRAAENNIPSVVVKRKEFETQLAYEEAVKAVLAENSIDMNVHPQRKLHSCIPQAYRQCASLSDSFLLRQGLLWTACARGGTGVRRKGDGGNGALCK